LLSAECQVQVQFVMDVRQNDRVFVYNPTFTRWKQHFSPNYRKHLPACMM